METSLKCECGESITVRRAAAGTEVTCECGALISIPSLAELNRQASTEDQRLPARTARYSLKKKIAFTAVTLLVLALPILFFTEIGYRLVFSIPLTGGVLYRDDLKMIDTPHNRQFASRFQLSENPILFYEPTPGAKSGPYVINSHGFRDHEYSMTRDPDVFRIAVLGDSIVWGHGLELEASFAKQLEQKLNASRSQQFEVLNFGVSGYSTQQEVELFRTKASLFSPDLVIVGYCLNDYKESSVEGAAFRRMYYDIFSKSYVLDHVKRAALGVSYNRLGMTVDDSRKQHNLRAQFALLQSYCNDRKNVVVIFPMLVDFHRYLFAFEHMRAKSALEGLNYETLDLLDTFKRYEADRLVIGPSDRTHPNEFGTAIAAEATMNLLIEKNLLPASGSDEAASVAPLQQAE